jgi:hypothetical protein
MFIQTESTPNPATLKFLPGREVMGEAPWPTSRTGRSGPLARSPRPCSAFPRFRGSFSADFISVTKSDGDWRHLKPPVLGAIMEHFTRGLPLIESAAAEGDDEESFGEGDPRSCPRSRSCSKRACVRPWPATAATSSSRVSTAAPAWCFCIAGSCAGCPSSTLTLKNGIENMLRHLHSRSERRRGRLSRE